MSRSKKTELDALNFNIEYNKLQIDGVSLSIVDIKDTDKFKLVYIDITISPELNFDGMYVFILGLATAKELLIN